MRFLAILLLAALPIASPAQTSQADLYAMETTTISAQLTNKIDSKNARVGDPVLALTTRDTRLSDGSRLLAGSRLAGHVTEVRARSDEDKTAHLAFSIDRAILRDGQEVPLHATLTAISGPVAPSFAADTSDRIGASTGGGMGASATPTTSSRSSHGNSATNPMGNAPTDKLDPATESGMGSARPVANVGATTTPVFQRNRVPIAGMPGVTFSSGINAPSTCSLDATSGRNITLDSGTHITLNVIATAQ